MARYRLIGIYCIAVFCLACFSCSSSSSPSVTPEPEAPTIEEPTNDVPVEPQSEVVPMTPGLITTNDLIMCDLPVYDWCDIDLHEPIYQISVEMVKGEIWQIIGEAEFTNDLGYNVCVVSSIKINNTIVGPVNGYNITPNMHHGIIQKNCIYKAKKTGFVTVQLCAMSASSRAESRDTIEIENMVTSSIGYGQLTAVRL